MATRKPTKAQSLASRTVAMLTDPAWTKANPMPIFGYRPEYHSQAEADWDRLREAATLWSTNNAIGAAFEKMPQPRAGEDFSRALTSWMDYAPTASPGVITAFAKANIPKDTPGLDIALAHDSELQASTDAKAQNPGGSAGQALGEATWLEDHTAWLRGITRTALDAAYAPLQAVQGGLSGAAGSLGILGANLNGQEADWGQAAAQLAGVLPFVAAPLEAAGVYKAPNPWEQTLAGQSLLDFMGMPSGTTTGEQVTPGAGTVNTGDGWLTADETSGVGLAQRQATYQSARNKYNESWSLGRGLFSMVTQSPDSNLYKIGSGFVDAAVSIFADPTIVGSKAKIASDAARLATRLAAARKADADQVVALIKEADDLTAAEKAAREADLAATRAAIVEDEKAWAAMPQSLRDEAQSLLDDEADLLSTRELDQASRDAWKATQREQATMPTSERYYDLTGQREELAQLLEAEQARLARNTGRRQTRGHIRMDEPTTDLVNDLHTRYGPDGLENHYAELSTDAGAFVEQYPGGVLTSESLVTVKRGEQAGGGFTTSAGVAYERGADGRYVFPGGEPFERTVFLSPGDAEKIRVAAAERATVEGIPVNEAGDLVGVTAHAEPRKGWLPLEYSADGSHHLGEKITTVVKASDTTADTAKWVPAYSASGEAVVGWTGRQAPVVRGADETLDKSDDLRGALEAILVTSTDKGVKAMAAAGQTRRETLRGYEALLTDPSIDATWGHLLSYAVTTGTSKALAEALARIGVDGISDARKAIGTADEGGLWWANSANIEVRALPTEVSSGMARTVLPLIKADIAGVRGRITAIDDELKGVVADAKDRVAAAAARYDAESAATLVNRLDENKAKREQLMTQAGIQHTPDLQRFVDTGKMYDFLFRGRHGERAFKALSEMTSPSDIMKVTGWDAKTAAGVAAATTREQILAAVAPEFGLKIDHGVGKISTGMRYSRTKAVERNRFFAGVERATGTHVPLAQRINYSDKDGMVKTLRNYMDFYGMDRTVTRGYLDKIIRESDEFNQRNHLTGLFDELLAHLLVKADKKNLLTVNGRKHLEEAARQGTRVYHRAEEAGHEYWQERIASGGWAGYLMSDGEHIKLGNAHLEAEFAQGGTILPDPRHVMETMGRVTGVVTQSGGAQAAYELVTRVTTDWWRTAMLLRGAYIVRNIAEEQIRMFLSGGQNVFANPLRMAAMALATRERSPAMTRAIAKFSTFDQGIDGTRFVVRHEDDMDLIDAHTDFNALMLDQHALMDMRTPYNLAVQSGIRLLGPKDGTGFSAGWGHQLLILRSDIMVRLVVGDYPKDLALAIKDAKRSGPVDEKTMIVRWLFDTEQGGVIRTRMGKSSDEMRKLMNDEAGLRDYVFGPVGSVSHRVDEVTTGQVGLRDFLRTGVLKNDGGDMVWQTAGRRLGPLHYTENEDMSSLGSVLYNQFKPAIPDGHPIKVPFMMEDASKLKEDPNIVDTFFNFAGRMERTAALGPEWKYSYWEEAAKRAHMLDADGLATMLKNATEVLPRTSPVLKILKSAKGEGTLLAEDVHKVAGSKASEHVKTLFYDARTRNSSWHQMRLVFPFGQAWGNTLTTWGKLMAQHPEQVYKFSKAMTALQSEDSNAIYEAYNSIDPFGDVEYDDSQGFIFNDENRGGQASFKYPMAASPLSGLLLNTQDAQLSLQAPVSGANLAFSGDNPLPGMGPLAVSVVGSTGITDNPGPIGDLIRAMVYPFGEPDPDQGVLESASPAWVRYAVFGSGFAPGGGEEFRRAQQKGALMATAARTDYGDLTDPVNQKRWFADADGVARLASFIRGFGSFILPASPTSDWQVKDKAGDWYAVATVASQYRQQEEMNGNDQAIVNLVEQYGEGGLAAILSSTGGDKPLADRAYKFTLTNPEEATRIGPNALALLFPGDPSPITLAWQKASGVRRDLSYAEKEDASLGLLWRYQMAEVSRAAVAGEWTKDQITEAKDAMLARFGGSVPARTFDPNYYQNTIQGIRNAIDSPVAGEIPTLNAAKAALAMYDEALAGYREEANDPRATLSGKKAAVWRDALHAELDTLLDSDASAIGVVDTLMSVTKEY